MPSPGALASRPSSNLGLGPVAALPDATEYKGSFQKEKKTFSWFYEKTGQRAILSTTGLLWLSMSLTTTGP
mgnify:CR=1 FL=1